MNYVDQAQEKLWPIWLQLRDGFKESCPDVAFDQLVGICAVENASLNPLATRFEPSVYEGAMLVKDGHSSKNFPGFEENSTLARFIKTSTNDEVRMFCSSWGLGQIMGYQYLQHWTVPLEEYTHLTLEEALYFMAKYAQLGFQYATSFEELLHWWNTGSTTGKTYSADYVLNALAAQAAWRHKYEMSAK